MVETLAYTYTSRAEMARLFTLVGFNNQLEDLVSVAQAVLEIIEEATDWINQYCSTIYEEADLADSRWVRSRATWYACYLLSQRGGNPALFMERVDRIEKELQKVLEQKLVIPRLPVRTNLSPVMSNPTIDDRFMIAKTRIHPSISTTGKNPQQDLSYIPPGLDLF